MKINIVIRNQHKTHSAKTCGNVGLFKNLLPKLFVYKGVCKGCFLKYSYGGKI